MTALSEDAKRRIVVELASFRTTLEVAVILQQEYDFEVRPNDLGRYDATRDYFAGGAALAELFHATRRKFVHDISDVPIANQGYRLRRLQRLSEAAERKGDYRLAAAIIGQVEKNLGGCQTKGRPVVAPVEQISLSEARRGIVTFLSSEKGRRLMAGIMATSPATGPDEATSPPDGEPAAADDARGLTETPIESAAEARRSAEGVGAGPTRDPEPARSNERMVSAETRDDGEAVQRRSEDAIPTRAGIGRAADRIVGASDPDECIRAWEREAERRLAPSPG